MTLTFYRWLLPLLSCFVTLAWAQSSPVRMLSGFPPGGNVDLLARLFAERISEALGRPVIVENRSGAAGQLAAEALKAAPPDGNTLMLAPDATVVVRPQTLRSAPYDPRVDFAAVALTGSQPYGFAISTASPAKDLPGFATWAKTNAIGATFASAGAGGVTHFGGMLISQALGVELRQVPYKGSGPAITDVAAEHAASTLQPLGPLLQQLKGPRIRLLALTGTERSPAVPTVPTFAELGHGSLDFTGFFGVFAPAATPSATIARLNQVVNQAMRTHEVRERMRNLDLDVRELSPAEFGAMVKTAYERWTPVIRRSGFSADSQ
jgi:tripartite-type tricarboxylate transporter receptor subunit TctC